MMQDWIDFIAGRGACDAAEHLGDLPAELAAARDGTVLAPLTEDGLIRATGEEAAAFLHNLLTNDVKNLEPGSARFAGLCTAKGRLIATFTIWHDGAELLLMLSSDILPGILKKLSMYVLRSKVRLSDAGENRVLLGLAGPDAGNLLADLGATPPAAPMQTTAFDGGQVIRLDERRFVLSLTPASAIDFWTKLSGKVSPIGTAAWRWLEITAGRPRIVAATQEAFIPQMVNMEVPALKGVSFHKGCYPGQEIVARTQYLGKVKRRMVRARLDAAFPAGTDVFTPEAGDQHCGALVTVAPSPEGGFECLVVVQSSGHDAGEVHVGSPTGPRLEFLPLPYAID
ncbi:MAG: folate-binding protein YgfZ [Sulfuritalea sp.]|nr:folate-binding protein YgfZ [Sulfuritalea sp.]